MVRLLLLVLLAPLLVTAAVVSPSTSDAAAPPRARADAPSVRVASANLREGSLLRFRTDLRAAHDRLAFARRLLSRPGPAPDVVLLQEVLGTAGRAAAALNAVGRSQPRPPRYVVATGTAHRYQSGGQCDGARKGRFSTLRSSAVLVNARTVTGVQAQGTVRTWGRWSRSIAAVIGRRGFGCTEHPWVRVTVRTPGGPRTATVLNVHAAPRDTRLKGRAIGTLRRELQTLTRQQPTEVTVLGGDFNLPRCGRGSFVERPGCYVRPAHRDLLASGFRDAVRDRRPSGPAGVNGVSRRIDFIYARARVAEAWWDRCYQAYRVTQWPCAGRAAFASPRQFGLCQARAQRFGRLGGGCPAAPFRRYYSDHPVLTAALR